MKRLFLALALTTALTAPAIAQTYKDSGSTIVPGFVPLVGCASGSACAGPVSNTNPMPITGTISASLGGFTPSASAARMTALSVTTSDSSGTLPTGAVVVVSNVGSNPMYCNVNGIAATTSDQLIAASSWFAFTIPAAITTLHCIATGGSTTADGVGGSGLPTGAGGGSSSGTVTANQGSANSAANAWPETLVIAGAVNSATNGIFVNPATGATFVVTESGTWTVQPGNTANTTPWLMTVAQGGNAALVKAANTVGTTDEALVVAVANTTALGQATMSGSNPVAIASDQSAIAVKGGAASGASLSGNPVPAAVRGSTADQTAVTDGQAVVPEGTVNGKLVTQPWALPQNLQSPTTTGQTGTSTVNVLAASGTVGVKEYMTSLQIGRSDAGTTAITATITDGTSTYTYVAPNNGGGGGNNITFTTPIAFAANHAVTCAASAGVTTFYCTAQGYNAP